MDRGRFSEAHFIDFRHGGSRNVFQQKKMLRLRATKGGKMFWVSSVSKSLCMH